MVSIYTLPIQSSWHTADTALLNVVSPQRRERILKYHFPIDRKLSLYAALLTRMQLSRQTSIPADTLTFSYEANHKPYLLSAPDYHFNFSHTKNMILCAISLQPVGADVEAIANAPFEVMGSVFHPAEIDYVRSAPTQGNKNTRFFKIWTSKEAIIKYSGTGLTDDLPTINTLDAKYAPHFLSWEEGGCLCSVYSTNLQDAVNETLSEEAVQAYFLNPSKGS